VKALLAAAALAIGLSGSIIGTLRAEVTAEEVRHAIDTGVKYLQSEQRPNGSWSDVMHHGGVTALCTLALLSSGVEPSDDSIQRALNYLRSVKPERTYVVSLQTMVFARASPERDLMLIRRNVRWLEENQLRAANRASGAWSYGGSLRFGNGDNSNSQFALLALHEAELVGISAKNQTWQLARSHWEQSQNPDGSWGYQRQAQGSGPGTGSMTCAGITSLIIASDRMQASGARVVGDRIECCRAIEDKDTGQIERGLRWLGQHYSVKHNPDAPGGTNVLYYLYGLERVGRFTARRFLALPQQPGKTERADWYREGADFLMGYRVALSGFWKGNGNGENLPVIGTSFAILFLSKGRWPVLISKLQHSPADDWNSHRNDLANLTHYVERKWKRDLTWQVMDLRLATVEDLCQTPVVYLCGSQDPVPEGPAKRKELAQKLRDYLDRGGFLFAEAYGDGKGFNKGFRALMKEVFPEPEYKLQLIEPEHPIWHAEEKVAASQLRPMWGIEFGCRTSVIYVPADPPDDPRASLSCLWELSRPGREEKYPAVVQAQVDAALSLGINVLAYATNRELRPNDIQPRPPAGQGANEAGDRWKVSVATLRHPGGCNAAPRAVANLMEGASRELKLRTRVREELLSINDNALFDYHLVFMHGRTAFHLTDTERERLRQFVERGGMLLADSICASRAFTESFRREMAAIFPKNKLERIPATDSLLTKEAYGGFDLKTVSRRDPATSRDRNGRLEATVRKVPPDLEGVKFGDRWGVIFSQYDLSCALEKHDSLECRGYTREDAARIGLNVILYSLQQ
jgi:hypothetical protein